MKHLGHSLVTALVLLALAHAAGAVPGDNYLLKSPVTQLTSGAATITLPVNSMVTHNFAGTICFNAASGSDSTLRVPTGGTETYTVETVNLPGRYQQIAGNTVQASASAQADWAANTKSVRVVLSGVTGNNVTHCQLIVTGNES